MAQCRGDDTTTAVTLRTHADPCPWPVGFSAPDHHTEVDNQRSTKLYSVEIHSKSVHSLTDLDGNADVIQTYPVIRSGSPKTDQYSITSKTGSAGKTEEISTTAEFCDETQKTTVEKLSVLYELDIP
jgi:hypothetical protein